MKQLHIIALLCLQIAVTLWSGLGATDYSSNASGYWNDASKWTPNGIPTRSDNVFVNSNHAITLNADAACNNLTITNLGTNRIICVIFTLSVYGQLNCAAVPASDLIGSGTIKLCGTSGAVIGPNWGANVVFDKLVFDPGVNNRVTFSKSIKFFSSLTISSGTVSNSAACEIYSSTANIGTVTVNPGAALDLSAFACPIYGSATTTNPLSSLTVDGSLLTRSYINTLSLTIGNEGLLKTTYSSSSPNYRFYTTANPPAMSINGTMEYAYAGASQYITPATYSRLKISNTSLTTTYTKALEGNITIANRLIIAGRSALNPNSYSLTYSSSAMLEYNGNNLSYTQTTAIAELPPGGGPNGIVVNNNSGVKLGTNVSINTISIIAGFVDTNGYTFSVNGMPYNSSAGATGTGSAVNLDIPPVNFNSFVYDTAVHINVLNNGVNVLATPYWQPGDVALPNTGLVMMLRGANLDGTTLSITHGLGFAPPQIAWREDISGSWGNWNYVVTGLTSTTAVIFMPASKANGDIEVVFPESEGETLPIELSSFTAVVTPQNFVRLDWVTQSETGVAGYYLYRNSTDNLNNAERVSPLIAAANTSHEQSYSFTDNEVSPGLWYYWLQNLEMDGQFAFHGPLMVTLNSNNDDDIPVVPQLTSLQGIYPNPFNPVTTIAFGLAKAEPVNIAIYNIRGEKVRCFFSATMSCGTYRQSWDGTDDKGRHLSTGVYFVRMSAGKYSSMQKAVLVK